MDLSCKWIWDKSGSHPRNYWLCFRKEFDYDANKQYEEVKLHIAADSRYVLFINGKKHGYGPVRYWNFEKSYDTYEIKNDLVNGKNCIAVLVMHYGISTNQYIEDTAGFLMQIDFIKNGAVVSSLKTDRTWKCCEHAGYQKNALRLSHAQAWSEIYDARRFGSRWMEIGYNDKEWGHSVEIGDVETFCKLIPRDIPFLEVEKVYPVRLESYKEVLPVKNSIGVNLLATLFPGEYDINRSKVIAYLCLNVYSPVKQTGNIIFPFSEDCSPRGDTVINGRKYKTIKSRNEEECVTGVTQLPGVQMEVTLDKGNNLLVMDISGGYHGYNVIIAFDFKADLRFEEIGKYGSKCILIGPFDAVKMFDAGFGEQKYVNYEEENYKLCKKIKGFDDLEKYSKHIRPIKDSILENVPYALCTLKKELREYEVTMEKQNFLFGNDSYTIIEPPGTGDLELIIDFGKELTGFIGFDLDACEGTVLDFYMFEYMNNDVIEDTIDLDNTLRYITFDGRQKYESPIRRGFRYAMLTIRNLTKPCRIYSVYTKMSTYPVVEAGKFVCSDYKLNAVWNMSKYTQKVSMEDVFVDSSAYEQAYWLGDSRIQYLINYYTFGSYEIVKRCLNLVPNSAQVTKYLMAHLPSGCQCTIPNWTFHWITACREYYEYSKDLVFLKNIYPHLLNTVNEYKKLLNNKGLFDFTGWNFVDWAPVDTPGKGVITHQNAVFVNAIRDVSHVASIIGHKKEAEWLSQLTENLKRAINLNLWSDGKKAYVDCLHEDGEKSKVISMQTNTMIYLYDCYEEDRENYLIDLLLDCPEDYVKIGTPLMSFFYIEALIKMGKEELVPDYIIKNWGAMLDYGATTCWEKFPGYDIGRLSRSHCQAGSAAPPYFLGTYILGVKPGKPGFDEVVIQPSICGLKWVKGSVPTPLGRIDIEWSINGKELNIKYKTMDSIKVKVVVDKEKWGIEKVKASRF